MRYRLIFFLFYIISTRLMAQDPDPLPLPSFPEKSTAKEVRQIEAEIDSLVEHNVIKFCEQKIDLSTRERQRKLKREMESLARYSSVLIDRANFFFPIVENILESCHVPEDFKYLMVIESGMNPYARSQVGATGLWQFMKGTAIQYGLRVDGRIDERFQIEKSTYAACRYLNDAYRKFGDWVAAAQSYNIGQARINYELEKQKVEDAIDLDLVEETNRYVYRILAAKILFTHPSNFGLSDANLYYKNYRRR